jgi:hypothetical protein
MSYRCGLGPSYAALGYAPVEPHIQCDTCGVNRPVTGKRGPYKWFIGRYLDSKPAPGWARKTRADGTSEDTCKHCRCGES